MILTGNDETMRKLAKEKNPLVYYNQGDVLSFEIEYSLCKIFEKEIELVKNLNKLQRDISIRTDFNLYEMFSNIDEYGTKYLSIEK